MESLLGKVCVFYGWVWCGAIRKWAVIVFPCGRLKMNRDETPPTVHISDAQGQGCCPVTSSMHARYTALFPQQPIPSCQNPGFSLRGSKSCFPVAPAFVALEPLILNKLIPFPLQFSESFRSLKIHFPSVFEFSLSCSASPSHVSWRSPFVSLLDSWEPVGTCSRSPLSL